MVKAQKRVDQLTERLATIDHSTVDHTEFTAVGTELAVAQAELDALESRWLELAELQIHLTRRTHPGPPPFS